MNFVSSHKDITLSVNYQDNLGKITESVAFLVSFIYLCTRYGANKRELREI
jgi:hypothetical protein